jgi:xanthine dehydrogenase small subunit
MPATQEYNATSDRIHFVLDGEVVSVDVTDPTRTILQYLREDLRRTGTKEGCAEGDCGACTVVLGELGENGELILRAVNSCIQFLPTVQGKQLITIESLSEPGGPLHPVQQAMVDCHGSQCGFCTPGFVMSLFALYKSRRDPSRREIDETLAGNLCRCTGYRPIIEAAETMYTYESGRESAWIDCAYTDTGAKTAAESRLIRLLQSIQPGETLSIAAAGRRFFAPVSMADLCDLATRYPQALILAGGTDVGLWVTKHLRELDTIIYLGGVTELKRITVADDTIEVGAAATLTDAMAVICRHHPDLEELFTRFASPPIRNAGTLGGNVANGSPIGDSMPALIALGSSVVLRKGEVTRVLPLDSFYIDYQKNELQPGEFLLSVRVPVANPGRVVRSYKISKRFDQDISAVCGAYCLELEGNTVSDIRIAYGGVAAIPKRAGACERILTNKEWNETSVQSAMAALDDDYQPIADMRAGRDYRSAVMKNLLYKFFLETSGTDHSQTRVYDHGR